MTQQILKPEDLSPGSSIHRVAKEAEKLELDILIIRMADSTRTAEDAAKACNCNVAQIVKSLVFQNAQTGQLILLLVSGRHNAELDHLAEKHDLQLERCDGRRVRDETGFAIGGVAPIGHKSEIPVYMDETLLEYPIVWAAAGRPDSVFSVSPGELAAKTGARLLAVRS